MYMYLIFLTNLGKVTLLFCHVCVFLVEDQLNSFVTLCRVILCFVNKRQFCPAVFELLNDCDFADKKVTD